MTYPKHVTIDTSRILDHSKEWWLKYADALVRDGVLLASLVVRAFANALPGPWPTAPGSTARTEHWTGLKGEVRIAVLDEDGNWYIVGYLRAWSVAELIAEGFTPMHDAGGAK